MALITSECGILGAQKFIIINNVSHSQIGIMVNYRMTRCRMANWVGALLIEDVVCSQAQWYGSITKDVLLYNDFMTPDI